MKRSALLIVDMINAFEFDGGRQLLVHARKASRNVLLLRDGFAARRWPVIYCNDNFGQWRSDFRSVIQCCSQADAAGAGIAMMLRPRPDDYFILKPKHSAFFSTPLELLLRSLRLKRILICGIAGDGCVLATATDAHIREYEVVVATDATASESAARNRRALEHLAITGTAELRATKTILSSRRASA